MHGAVLGSLEPDDETRAKVSQDGQWLLVRIPDGTEGYVAAWHLRLVKRQLEMAIGDN